MLLLFATVFSLTGLRALIAPTEDEGQFILYTYLEPHWRALLWFVPAALAVAAAFRGTGRDGFGFAALSIPATIVAFSYLWSWIGYFAGATDYSLGWSGFARWALVLAMILVVSSWKEADEPPPLRPTSEREGSPVG